ncbi:hypothetical protein KC343_g8206 [Hortaea werneckii]|nr:hypothetical protein KC338_g4425 [Hortaea werneckii]KAI6867553.1 hypothetical protein KC323_g3465 [Hortaea werneckii]KAI7139833.1 hypothetical protein KC352_g29728 [Hortaea werneckii]KAI7349715.1 hypothetical protein KC320_g5928 [Hortaea werneckii]KAI7562697.1 hypothetical protein KC317_g8236 [Hortaea werneckii]
MESSQPSQGVQCSSSSATQQTSGSETTQKDSLTQPPSNYLPPASHYTYRSSRKIYNRKLISHNRNGVMKRYGDTQPKARPTHIDPAKLSKAPMVRATIDPPARDYQPSGQRTSQADGDGHAVKGEESRHRKPEALSKAAKPTANAPSSAAGTQHVRGASGIPSTRPQTLSPKQTAIPASAQSAPPRPTQQEQDRGNSLPLFPLVLPVLDPSLLTSPAPLAGGRSISVFANEVAGLNPSVLSPMLMARMPFGGCVEVACHYPRESTREME